MIAIEKHDFTGRQCGCCYSRMNVLDIHFKGNGYSSVVALCDKCRKELMDELKRHGTEEKNEP